MIKLGVNIDHVATLRQTRQGKIPNVITAAGLAELAGADSIVLHIREDRRHVKEEDLRILKETMAVPINLEMALNPEIIDIALDIKPDRVTIVPERREELTTEGGLDVIKNEKALKKIVPEFNKNNIKVSVFIDPNRHQIEAAKRIGAQIIELHTGYFVNVKNGYEFRKEYHRLLESAISARNMRFFVAAGHGLNYMNIIPLLKIREIEEYNIGHSIVCHSIFVGIYQAVKEMREILNTKFMY